MVVIVDGGCECDVVWLSVGTVASSGWDVGCFGADITHIFNTITTNSPPNAMRNGFFGAVGTYNAEISGVTPWGNGSDWDEEHGVGPGNRQSTLCQAMDFSSIGLLPEGAI